MNKFERDSAIIKIDDTIDWLPEHCREGLRAYLIQGRPTGGFLAAVLSGEHEDAMRRADSVNAPRLNDYFRWLVDEAPIEAYGTRAKYLAWIERGGIVGK